MSTCVFQVESEDSRSGSSLSLRNMAPAIAANSGNGPQGQSPSHGTAAGGHRGVQRSISATSSKPRRGSTGADNNSLCESQGASCSKNGDVVAATEQQQSTTATSQQQTGGTIWLARVKFLNSSELLNMM